MANVTPVSDADRRAKLSRHVSSYTDLVYKLRRRSAFEVWEVTRPRLKSQLCSCRLLINDCVVDIWHCLTLSLLPLLLSPVLFSTAAGYLSVCAVSSLNHHCNTYQSPPFGVALITAKPDVIHKTGSTQRSTTPPEEDWATATGEPHTKFCADRSSSSRHI